MNFDHLDSRLPSFIVMGCVLAVLAMHSSAEAQVIIPNLSVLPASSSGPASAAVVIDPWLGADGVVTEAAVNRLTQILQNDAAGADLVKRASQHAMDTIHDQLWKAVSVCAEKLDPNTLGLTTSYARINLWRDRDIQESAFKSIADIYYKDIFPEFVIKNDVAAGTPYAACYFPDILLLKTYTAPPGICLKKDLSVHGAVDVLFHEMVHYVATDFNFSFDMASFMSEQDYELMKIQSTGDEVDAYLSQWSYEIRIGGKNAIQAQLQPFFTDQGAFIPLDPDGKSNRLAVAHLILEGPIFLSGEGYHQLLYIAQYRSALKTQSDDEAEFLELLQRTLEMRQKNTSFLKQYSRGLDKSSAREVLQENENSIARLPGEENQCNARIDHLKSLTQAFVSEFGADPKEIAKTN